MTNFLLCTVLPPGASEVVQTHKFEDFLIKIKFVRYNVMNNFEFVINSLGCTVFTLRASEIGKIQPFCRKNCFLVNFSVSHRKNVHLWELVMSFKVVINNIVDIIHFDQNTIRSNLKELCKI